MEKTLENSKETERPSVVGIITSFAIPIVGVVIYFIQRHKTEQSKDYLQAATAGFLLWFLIRFFMFIQQM